MGEWHPSWTKRTPNMGHMSPETGSFCIPTLPPPPQSQAQGKGAGKEAFPSLADTQPPAHLLPCPFPLWRLGEALPSQRSVCLRVIIATKEPLITVRNQSWRAYCVPDTVLRAKRSAMVGRREWGRTKAGGVLREGPCCPWAEGLAMPAHEPRWSGT